MPTSTTPSTPPPPSMNATGLPDTHLSWHHDRDSPAESGGQEASVFGGSGWTQRASFVVTGLLILAFAFGLRAALRRYGAGVWAALLIGLFALGLIGSGVFITDPISGYPPGTPLVPDRTTHGVLHDIFGTPVFLGLPVACLTGFVVTSMGFAQNPTLMPIGGLLQRITIVIGWAWLTALALYLLRP